MPRMLSMDGGVKGAHAFTAPRQCSTLGPGVEGAIRLSALDGVFLGSSELLGLRFHDVVPPQSVSE